MDNDLAAKGFFAKLIFFLAVVSFVVIVIITGWGRSNVYNDRHKAAEFCGNCHEMNANYMTWQYTAHSEVLCTRCHQQVSPTLVALRYLTSSYSEPIKLRKFMDDSNCLQCHKPDRDISPPGDLIIPHKLHMEKGIDCIDCHNNVSHGNIYNDKLVNGTVKPAGVTKDLARNQVSKNNSVNMDTCMRCHNGAKASNACSACHKIYRQPQQ